jgi:hypothetical protein
MKQYQLKCFLSMLALLCFLSTNLNAQYYSGFGNRQKSSIGFSAGSYLGYRILSGDNGDDLTSLQIANREKFEVYKPNLRLGIAYQHGLNNRFLLITGLGYSQQGFKFNSIQKIDFNSDINNIEKAFDIDGYNYVYSYQFIEAPVGIKYMARRSACTPYIELGVIPTLYTSTLVTEETPSGISKKSTVVESISTINLMGFFTFGGDIALSQQTAAFTQLHGRYQFNNLRTGKLKEQLISLGIDVGFRVYL